MFSLVGRVTARHPLFTCAAWIVVGALLSLVAPSWDTQTQDDDVRFIPERFTSVRAYHLLSEAFPQDVSACKALFAIERDDRPLSEKDFVLVDRLVEDLERLRQAEPALKIGKIESYKDGLIGCRLTSGDRQCTLVQVNLGSPYLAVTSQSAVERAEKCVRRRLKDEADAPQVHITGAAGVGRDLTKAAGASLDGTTWATVGLVIVVLLIVYRAPLLALVPLVTIGISVWVSLKLLAIMTLIPGVHLVNISKVFAIVILYGAGTDYCLFLISRYREELQKGYALPEAIVKSVGGVGLALAASAGTVMVGLGLMALAEFAKVRYAGPAIALSLGIALVASLTLTPAMLRLLGKKIFWPGKPPIVIPQPRLMSETAVTRTSFWDWVSRGVARRPLATWVCAVGFLLPFIAIGVTIQPSYRATAELSPRAESLQGLDSIQRHFTAGEVGPITVLLASPVPWDSDAGLMDITLLSKGFAHLPNVAEVRSLTQPLGWSPPDLHPSQFGEGYLADLLTMIQPMLEEFRTEMRDKATEHYLAKIERRGKPFYVTRLDVVPTADPFSPASAETLRLIHTWLHDELPRSSNTKLPIQAECFGVTANAMDLADVTESDRSHVNMLVLAAIFVILLALVRRTWLAAYLLVTVLASYYSALGATALMGWFWTGHVLHAVDWRVPFFLFTILVAVGEDYNILLVHRALQEQRRYGRFEGMRRALGSTGGAITSCGLIMAGTFATLMIAGLNTLMQIGFALAFGVLIDTFVVRPFLVPAFCLMVWENEKHVAPAATPPELVPVEADAMERVLGSGWRAAA
jgi:RND superfamily putative drug exporter